VKRIPATEAKQRLGQALESALREPVAISKSGRVVAYLLSAEEYHRLQEGTPAPDRSRALTLKEQVLAKSQVVRAICAARGASNVRLFGSAARGEESPDSDLDFLVTLERGRSLLDVAALANDLEELFGRRVDVLVEASAKNAVLSRARKEAVRVA
jgi:uncharacterized protein